MSEQEIKLTFPLLFRNIVWIFLFAALGVLWALCSEGMSSRVVQGCVLAFFLSGIAVLDFRYGLIFDRWLAVMLLCVISLKLFFGHGEWVSAIISAAGFSGLLLFLRAVSHGGMGGGDIKLAFVLGLWLSWPGTFMGAVVSFWIGGLAALFLLIKKEKTVEAKIPFGPFLALGSWIAFLYGNELWAWLQGL